MYSQTNTYRGFHNVQWIYLMHTFRKLPSRQGNLNEIFCFCLHFLCTADQDFYILEVLNDEYYLLKLKLKKIRVSLLEKRGLSIKLQFHFIVSISKLKIFKNFITGR